MSKEIPQIESFTLTLPPQAIEAVLAGLGEIPTKFGGPVMGLVQQQVQQQVQEHQAKHAAPPTAPEKVVGATVKNGKLTAVDGKLTPAPKGLQEAANSASKKHKLKPVPSAVKAAAK